jgi:transcription elongation GreA/GreB family factor
MHNLLTPAGAVRLQARLRKMQTQDLMKAQADVVQAREEGKLEENESYLHAQEQCRMIERRISELSSVLETYEVTDDPPMISCVGFGSKVLIEDCNTEKQRWVTLVGEPEADISIGCVSITSPLGEALLGAVEGDVVDLVIPKGTTQYEIIQISA